MEAFTEQLRAGENLTDEQVGLAATQLLDEAAEIEEKAAFLAALSGKGETPAEIAAFVTEFLKHAVRPPLAMDSLPGPSIDVCGTGGDKLNLFNVSTTSMFILAAGGAVVVKHGNRGITSKCGGADVLEELGVRIDLSPEQFAETVATERVGFMLAPHYHPAFKAVAPVRKLLAEKGIRTIFNLIGPLLNPVQPDYQLVGVFDSALPPIYAEILGRLGRNRAWAVHGKTENDEGMDEISTLGPTTISQWDGSGVSALTLNPQELGLRSGSTLTELQGHSATENAQILEGVLIGSATDAQSDIALLNAAAGFVVTGLSATLEAGLERARDAVTSGAALGRLRALQAIQ
ncbi:MAG: anthranilate phosphoribosyltransferase [Verrucomicrobia bacterium]|nr:anthranilate phosphoribosyltransferase [Verrucomicrobiota bacterium]